MTSRRGDDTEPSSANDGDPGSQPEETDYVGGRDLAAWPTRWGRGIADATVAAAIGVHRYFDRRSIPYVVLLVITAVGAVAAGLLTALSAEIYDNVSDRQGIAGLDRPVLDEMTTWRSPGLDEAVTDFTDLGSTTLMPWIAAVGALLLAWWWRRWTPVVLMAVATVGSVAMTIIGKQAIGRARPETSLAVPPYESSPSFPSGHTLNAWVIALLVAYLVCLRLGSFWGRLATVTAALAFALAMALSRVYLGHHWLTDVLVGITLGSAWLLVVITGHRLAVTVRRRQRRGRAFS